MKKILFISMLASPLSVSAQAPAEDSLSGGILLYLIIIVIVFFLCRELMCWYYKINKMISNQNEIIAVLTTISTKEQKIDEKPIVSEYLSKARMSFAKGNMDEAEDLLNYAFLEEITGLAAQVKSLEEWDNGFSKVKERYKIAFEKVGNMSFDFNKYRNINMYLL